MNAQPWPRAREGDQTRVSSHLNRPSYARDIRHDALEAAGLTAFHVLSPRLREQLRIHDLAHWHTGHRVFSAKANLTALYRACRGARRKLRLAQDGIELSVLGSITGSRPCRMGHTARACSLDGKGRARNGSLAELAASVSRIRPAAIATPPGGFCKASGYRPSRHSSARARGTCRPKNRLSARPLHPVRVE